MYTDQGSCSSQIVGTLGSKLTLLCLANEPVTSAVWTTPDGMRASDNITFSHLTTSDAGVYICLGHTVGDHDNISSSVSLKISSEWQMLDHIYHNVGIEVTNLSPVYSTPNGLLVC